MGKLLGQVKVLIKSFIDEMKFLLVPVIMLMTVCCFLLPPMAGEKVTVNGFAFVAAVMYLIYFSNTLPFHETEVPILGKEPQPNDPT